MNNRRIRWKDGIPINLSLGVCAEINSPGGRHADKVRPEAFEQRAGPLILDDVAQTLDQVHRLGAVEAAPGESYNLGASLQGSGAYPALVLRADSLACHLAVVGVRRYLRHLHVEAAARGLQAGLHDLQRAGHDGSYRSCNTAVQTAYVTNVTWCLNYWANIGLLAPILR